MTDLYNHYKNLFESIEPIRGRVISVRPIGKRRRDWETIRMAGDVVECVLYETPVVRYYPDGGIGVQANDWVTPSTAEFMYTHSPFAASKKNGILWVCPNRDKKQIYPLPVRGETRFVLTGDNPYKPSFSPTGDNPNVWKPEVAIMHSKKVIDRAKAKEAREPYMPFLRFVETFLKMSDGWVMETTKNEMAAGVDPNGYRDSARYDFGLGFFVEAHKVLDRISIADESDYLQMMCLLLQITTPKEQRKGFGNRYDHKKVRAKLYRMIDNAENVHAQVEVKYE